MKALALFSAFLLSVMTLHAQKQPDPFDEPDPFDANVRTGPAVGERIPAFRALDQHGRSVDFDAIKGPRGAVLLFYRSADW
jgi:hypothetical protein